MNHHSLPTLALAAVLGATIWLLSPWVTGHTEPWDGAGPCYFAALIVAGLLAGVASPKPVWAHYLGSVIGQLGYGLMFLEQGPLAIVGAGFLLVCCVPVAIAALAAGRLRAWWRRQRAEV